MNGIAPGVVEWPNDFPESEKEKYLKRVPLGRAGTPKDVADTVHFLCTAGGCLTGRISSVWMADDRSRRFDGGLPEV